MKKILFYMFGIIACCYFWATLAYGAGFFLNMFVPKSIDSGQEGPIIISLIINILLLSAFGIQHSAMARKEFKKWWTKLIPESLERSVYVIFASAIMWIVMLNWQPMTGLIWDIQNIYLKLISYTFFILGGLMVVHSIFVLSHFDYVGLRQINLHFKFKGFVPLEFQTPSVYKYIRHPMTVGILIFFWATPKMTIGHLLFAAGMTIYSIIGLKLEERDLICQFGEVYETYKQNVGMFLPGQNKLQNLFRS
jgi:methanethiol S-methyltransferase